MADDNAAGTAAQPPKQEFSIQKVYLRDVSFEGPNSPQLFAEGKWEPTINLQLGTTNRQVGENFYEVTLAVSVSAKIGDKTAYLIEVQQAGVFRLSGFGKEELGPMLGSFCPNILFPFAREEVAELATKGGFPQLLLEPINFDAVYAQGLQQRQPAAPATADA